MATIEDLEWELCAKQYQLKNAINKDDRAVLKAQIVELVMMIEARRYVRGY